MLRLSFIIYVSHFLMWRKLIYICMLLQVECKLTFMKWWKKLTAKKTYLRYTGKFLYNFPTANNGEEYFSLLIETTCKLPMKVKSFWHLWCPMPSHAYLPCSHYPPGNIRLLDICNIYEFAEIIMLLLNICITWPW